MDWEKKKFPAEHLEYLVKTEAWLEGGRRKQEQKVPVICAHPCVVIANRRIIHGVKRFRDGESFLLVGFPAQLRPLEFTKQEGRGLIKNCYRKGLESSEGTHCDDNYPISFTRVGVDAEFLGGLLGGSCTCSCRCA